MSEGIADVVCPGCGSSFRIEDLSTTDEVRVLGKFHLLNRVGGGAFGAVWRAHDAELDRVVALKIPHKRLLDSPDALARLQREARAVAQLRHPGIVRLYQVEMLDGLPTLVSDFIEGVSLKELIDIRWPTFREAASVIADVADALEYAHTMGLVHRDIKPANIMIERKTPPKGSGDSELLSSATTHLWSEGKPIIVDFGLALRAEAEIVLTIEGQIIGTPAFMSPEQAQGHGHAVNRRSDLYSLGIVLYQLLCCELPFRGSLSMILHAVAHEEPRHPRQINNKIPRDLETICLKAIAKRPAWRYATAQEMAADLHRFLRGEPIRARPVTKREQFWRWRQRNPALAATGLFAGFVFLALIVLSITFVLYQAQSLRESRRLSASLALDQGLTQCNHSRIDEGMMWLAKSLTLAPKEDLNLQRTIRMNLGAWYGVMRPLRASFPHDHQVVAVTFSPDGKRIVTASFDKTARLWETASGAPLSVMQHDSLVHAVAISPDGNLIVTGSEDNSTQFWDANTGKRIHVITKHTGPVRTIAFSPDGQTVATGSGDATVSLWEAKTGNSHGIVLSHDHSVTSVGYSPDGRTLVTGSVDGSVGVWEVSTGVLKGRVRLDESRVMSVAFSPSGMMILTSHDKTAQLWDVGLKKAICSFTHEGIVRAAVFSPDGNSVLTGSSDRLTQLWHARSGRAIGPPLFHRSIVNTAAFSPDGQFIVLGMEELAELHETSGMNRWTISLPHQSEVAFATFSTDGKTLATGTKDYSRMRGEAWLWDLSGTKQKKTRVFDGGLVLALALSSDGQMLAVGSTDNSAQLIAVPSGKLLCPPLQHRGWVHSLAFSPNGRQLLTGGEDGTVRFWDTSDGQLSTMGMPFSSLVTTAKEAASLWEQMVVERRYLTPTQVTSSMSCLTVD